MPLFLVSKLKAVNYNSEKFINWYIRFPDIKNKYSDIKQIKNKKAILFWGSAYYVWVFYVLSCIVVATFSVIVGIIGVLLSPFIVGGYIYAMAYLFNESKKILRRKNK